ncbi:MAG TPA: anion permease [Thermoplasmata archaeon]|nr:anion permease [Thermoplasmata archaeon]
MLSVELILLVVLALAFAFSIGAHYTGACMGMPYAAGAIGVGRALLLLAPLAFLGAALASEGVEQTVGHGLLVAGSAPIFLAVAILASALLLTTAYNLVALPTSTIQILVFSTVGAALAGGYAVEWATLGRLLLVWILAPPIACGLGYLFGRIRSPREAKEETKPSLAPRMAFALVAVGAIASFAMGANDVANASGALILSGNFTLVTAALVGGAGLAVGAFTWGRPLLQTVAFRIVRLDPSMAFSAQLAQAAVILGAVAFGLFTSINQVLVGAMIGTGLARRRATLIAPAIRNILIGWALGPISGLALGLGLGWAVLRAAGLG